MKQKWVYLIAALCVLVICCLIFNYITDQINLPSESFEDNQIHQPENSPLPAALPFGLKVHFIDVGQGDSMLIQTPNGKAILVDAGENSEGEKIVEYLKAQGIRKLDVLVGTHPHEDHIGGMDLVVDSFDIGRIYMPKKSTTTKTFKDLLNAIKYKNLKVDTAMAGVGIDVDESVQISMIAPNSNDYEDLNNYSVVIKLTYNNTSFLLTGDAQNISEKEMLSKGYNLKSDVLKVGHHGSHSSTTQKFLKAVSPEYAVISLAKENDYRHPHKETLKKLSDEKIQVFRTDESGTIIALSDGKTIKFEKSKPQRGDFD